MSETRTFHAGGYGITVESINGQVTAATYTCTAHGNPSTCEQCYRDEVRAFGKAQHYVVYVEENTMQVTTFAGRTLGRIQLIRHHRARYTPTGGRFRLTTVHVRAADGSQWWGRFGDTQAVCLHRVKTAEVHELTVQEITRENCTSYGNPRFTVKFFELDEPCLTSSDESDINDIGGNIVPGRKVRVVFTPSGRIKHIRLAGA
jgi:hypothetical protein